MADPLLLSVKDAAIAYGDKVIFEDLSFNIHQGSKISIVGKNGAGKTTLIRHLMTNAGGRRLAVLVNEFGTVGVDGDILKSCAIDDCPAENIVELANGCICCTVADEFLPTLDTLLARPDPPHHIIIETSGLALPQPLVRAFNWPAIRTRITVDGVVTVVDGHPHSLSWIAGALKTAAFPLGVDRYGQSGNPSELYREYEIDAQSIMAACFGALGI